MRTIAQATGTKDAALDLIARTARRADIIRLAVRDAPRPRVAALEWLDPVVRRRALDAAAHRDGRRRGRRSACAGEPSEQSTWELVAAAQPDVVVVMPCGYDAARALVEAEEHADAAARRSARSGSSRSTPRRTSRGPGPRLVDGLELLAHILHPDRVPSAPAEALAVEL